MGVIFAVEKDGVVYMGADAVIKQDGVNYRVDSEENLKIRKMPSGILLACCGKNYLNQQMYLHDEWFELAEGEKFDKRFIVTKLIANFSKAISRIDGWNVNEEENIKNCESAFIIAKDGDFYAVFNDLSVVKCDRVAAFCLKEDTDMFMICHAKEILDEEPEEIVRKTFSETVKRFNDVDSHCYIINTRDMVFEKMEVGK